ncbi:alpha tubulin suppressor [Coemansia javaensis]|uniref:Alpha tubulin suppressor n=1 Tax=Coemansia javaensis TaxID=2761396 RepID=A0A9W8LMC0_9FUNG|nr:alpha tubulin suppressor [Coemansia javaensis]
MDDAHRLVPCAFAAGARQPRGGEAWSVCGGGNHAFMWPQNGACLLASGSNQHGELGVDPPSGDPALEWVPVVLPGPAVRQVACGWNHTLLLSTQGRIYAAGANGFGQLGLGPPQGSQPAARAWTQVDVGAEPAVRRAFVAVACGLRHSLALDEDGVVFGWGANRSGQLGLPADKRSPVVWSATRVSAGLPPIAMAACGRNHSILVAQDLRTVFVAGQDTYAQCGPGVPAPANGAWRTFTLPRPALKLCAGWDFGAALLGPAADGRVVMWGRCDHGQLAAPPDPGARCCRELRAAPLAGVRDLACGSNHAVAVAGDGTAHSWGWNEHGNAGDPSLADVLRPLALHGAADVVGCGYGNTWIIGDPSVI